MKKTCSSCGISGRGKQGSLADNAPPGWGVSMSNDGRIQMYCSPCSEQIEELVDRLVPLLGTDYGNLHALSLMREKRTVRG